MQELEALRAEGKIRFYGLATWDSFRTAPDALLVGGSWV
jgi:aryl-alcohol dehydrogenase-like predicted oxidoreductase